MWTAKEDLREKDLLQALHWNCSFFGTVEYTSFAFAMTAFLMRKDTYIFYMANWSTVKRKIRPGTRELGRVVCKVREKRSRWGILEMVGIGRNETKFTTLRNILYEKGMGIGANSRVSGSSWISRYSATAKIVAKLKSSASCSCSSVVQTIAIDKCTLRPSHYLQARTTRQDSSYNHDLKWFTAVAGA